MDEIEKNNFSSIKKALEQIQMLGLSERMNPYHDLIQSIGIATTNHKEVFELAKTIGNVAGTSNFLRLVQPIVNSESLSISKSVASIAATIMGESPTFIRNLRKFRPI